MATSNKVVFLDRDGVINKDVAYLHKIEDFKFMDGIFEACTHFGQKGYQIIVVTNQSGIGRGYYQESDFQMVNQWMLDEFSKKGVTILDVFFCPHRPEDSCDCRKPKPGMFKQAQEKYFIDMGKSWMIGDKEVDIIAASLAGIRQTILVTRGPHVDDPGSQASCILKSIKNSVSVIS